MSTNRLIKCGKEFKGNGGCHGRKEGPTGIDEENRGSLREVGYDDGVFGVQNGITDDNIGCDVVNSGANANEEFGVENEVVGENIGQDIVDGGVEENFGVGVNSDDLCVDHVESLGEDRSQMIERVGRIESGNVVVDDEFGNHSKEVLKKNDIIHFKVNEKDKWTVATISGSQVGKCTGKHKSWYNVRNHETGVDHSLDLDNVTE